MRKLFVLVVLATLLLAQAPSAAQTDYELAWQEVCAGR